MRNFGRFESFLFLLLSFAIKHMIKQKVILADKSYFYNILFKINAE